MSTIKIDVQVLRKIAKLARLRLSPEEENLFTQDLQKILEYVEHLNQLDTRGVEPIVHGFPMPTRFREDKALPLSEAETQEILACSEEPIYGQYRVPQVIGGES